jgi:predicted phage terminase large subunit-like protein
MAMRLLRQTVIENPYIPRELNGHSFPSVPQAYFLTLPVGEALYGGAAGGGKSAALLAGALQYVTVQRYAAILFRRTLTDLEMPGALIPMSHEWLHGTGAQWNGSEHKWTFPSGATLSFGYMKDEGDHFRYKSAAFQYVGFDELTSFREHPYRFLFGRLRKPDGMPVPLRQRSASNPGDIGHEWVKERFIEQETSSDKAFVRANLDDNPGLDRAAYREMLARLDPVTRAQMQHGNWDIRPEGNLFKRTWFDLVDEPPALRRVVRCWDLAATEKSTGNDPDYAVGAKVGIDKGGTAYVMNILRVRATPQEVERTILQTAELDGTAVGIRMEQEPGSSGKSLISVYQRLLPGYACRGVPSTGDKVTRANPFSSACERGAVKIMRGPWVGAFLDELCAFPVVGHDDQVDAVVGAYSELTAGQRFRFTSAPVAVVG